MDLPMTQTSPAEFQYDRRHTETDSTLRLSRKETTQNKTQKTESECRALRLRGARGGAERCACQWLRVPCDEVVKAVRGSVDVVTSRCADEMAGVLPTSTTESNVCKARPGQSARTTMGKSRSNSAGSARKRTRSRRRCLRVRPRLARSRTSRVLRAAKTTPSTPASAPASITQENGGNNVIKNAIAGEP